ncbi:MAG: Flp pilus assembly protein CpaB [Actinobacteria bacterium]|nr:Flp pilus assembly protein CpaB [Actinomycetota bacterium]
MSQRRTLILVAAIAIGALASFLVWNYVNGVQDEAFDNAEQVPVYLVKQNVARGTSGIEAQAYIAKENIPRKFKPGNAIASIEDISGKVAVNDLVPNQVVVSDMFVDASDPAARASFSERLTKIRNEDQVAISLSVDQVRGVAGLVRPGDFVNILLANQASTGDDTNANPAAAQQVDFKARYLYQKAQVLAVGQDALPQAGAAAPAGTDTETTAPTENAGLITLIVPAKAAQYVASVDPTSIYLVLVARDYKPVPQAPIELSDLLPAEDAGQLTPYGKDGPDSSE